jgi:hypothetical protein
LSDANYPHCFAFPLAIRVVFWPHTNHCFAFPLAIRVVFGHTRTTALHFHSPSVLFLATHEPLLARTPPHPAHKIYLNRPTVHSLLWQEWEKFKAKGWPRRVSRLYESVDGVLRDSHCLRYFVAYLKSKKLTKLLTFWSAAEKFAQGNFESADLPPGLCVCYVRVCVRACKCDVLCAVCCVCVRACACVCVCVFLVLVLVLLEEEGGGGSANSDQYRMLCR